MTYAKIQLRRGTAAEWYNANPVLADGESGYERDSNVFKVGDGVTNWRDLPTTNPQYLLRSEYIPGASALGQLSDVAVAGATINQVLTYDGTKWISSDASGGAIPFGVVRARPASTTTHPIGSTWAYATFDGPWTFETLDWDLLGDGVNPAPGVVAAGGGIHPTEAGLYQVRVRGQVSFSATTPPSAVHWELAPNMGSSAGFGYASHGWDVAVIDMGAVGSGQPRSLIDERTETMYIPAWDAVFWNDEGAINLQASWPGAQVPASSAFSVFLDLVRVG